MKKIFLIFLVVFIFISLFFAGKILNFFKAIGVKSAQNIAKITKPKTTYTTVLLGYGGGNHEGAYLTDSIMVVHVDYARKRALLISIPRDVWVPLPTKSKDPFHSKINAVYQMGVFPNDFPDVNNKIVPGDEQGLLKQALNKITGLTIDSFVAVDFTAFTQTIDELGGIDVEVDRSFVDTQYPIEGKEKDACGKEGDELAELEKVATDSPELNFPCRYETITFNAGETHLDGEQALKYSRSRHSPMDGGDFARAARQQKVIEAVKDKVLSPFFVTKIIPLMDGLKDKVTTDGSYEDIQKLLKEIPKVKEYTIEKLILSDDNYLKDDVSDNGQFILAPSSKKGTWTEIQTVISRLSKGLPLTPTTDPDIKK